MRPIMFCILLYLMSGPRCRAPRALPFGANEEWPVILFLPMLAIFYALFSAETMPLTALACGAVIDLTTQQLVGTNMIPLALAAMLIAQSRTVIFREHAMAQMVMTFAGLVVFAALSVIYRKMIRLARPRAWQHVVAVLEPRRQCRLHRDPRPGILLAVL